MTAPPSREPSDYKLTYHYLNDSLPSPLRFLTQDRVEQALLRGVDYPNQGGPGKLRRKHEIDGVNVVIVIPQNESVVVTAWLKISNWTDALNSDTWTTDQLRTIRAFNDREHKKTSQH